MKRLAILLAVIVCLWPGAPRAASFSMEQAVSRALEVNPTVQSKLLMLERARMNVGVAQSYFWPRVSLVGSHNVLKNKKDVQTYSSDDMTSKSWSQGVRLTLSLFAGFAHLNNLQKSLLQTDVEDARHRQARLELVTNVQLQFLALLQARENLSTAEESARRIRKQLEASEAFVRVDMAPYANVLQNRVELSRAQQEVIRCRNDIRNAEVQLNRYLGFSPNERVTYTGRLRDFDGTVSYTEEQAIKTALYSRRATARTSTTGATMTIPATTGPRASISPGTSSAAAAPCSTPWPSGTGQKRCKKTLKTPWPGPVPTSSVPCWTWMPPGNSSPRPATVSTRPGKITPCRKNAT